jgi:hypothetical protein
MDHLGRKEDHPFPVIIMCRYQGKVPFFSFQLPDQFYILIFESPGMLPFAKADAFYGFNKEITEMPVKCPGYPVNFLSSLFRKRKMEIFIHYFFPVTDQVEIDKVKQIGNPVNQPEWYKRDKPGKTK